MAEFDCAVFGTGLLPTLLAGLLASRHGRKVVRVGRKRSAQRLPRGLDLALPLSVHPMSWQLVRRGVAELSALRGEIGLRQGVSEGEVAVAADQPDSEAALDHVAHLAVFYGHQLRRSETGWALRRVPRLDGDVLADSLAAWLDRLGVAMVEAGPVDAALTILADDAALLEHMSEAQRPAALLATAMTASLVVAPRGLPAPVQLFPDRGVTLAQRGGGTVLALVSGAEAVAARLASCLAGPFPMKRLASARYRGLVSRDGAPVVGRLRRTKTMVVAGLGSAGAFLAPTLARLLADAPEPDEKRWAAAHGPAAARAPVADFAPFAEMGA